MKAGIHQVSEADYHADPCDTPSLSNSLLTTLLQRTPQHAWLAHPRLNPDHQPTESSTFDLGKAAHRLLLEGIEAVAVVDAEDWRTKRAQEARDEARKAGKIPLLPHHVETLTAMVTAAREYVAASGFAGIFDRGAAEQTLVWKDSGVMCRARLDWLSDDREVVLDYKSTGAEGPDEFVRNMIRHGYDTQSVWYPRGLAALGHRNARFVFLVQETTAPYCCYLMEPAESMVELATSKIARGLQLWKECLRTNTWPAYPPAVHQAEAPVWAMKEEEAYA